MLIDILKEVAAADGYNLSDQREKDMLIYRVNQAALELHFNFGIREAQNEIIVDFDQESQQVALPEFVKYIRGMRWHISGLKVDVDDIKNRYNHGYGNELWPLKYRQVKTSPFSRDLANESILTLSLPLVEATAVSITIAGTTEHSSRDSETITFNPGDLEKQTTLNFKDPIYSVSKSRVSKYDITIKDVEENIVCVFPNYATNVSYRILQLTDSDIRSDTGTAIEVLYTEKFKKAREDTDTFWGTEDYDSALVQKFIELYGSDEAGVALMHQAKANSIMNGIQSADHHTVREKLSFKRNPFYNMPYDRTRIYGSRFSE